MSEFLYKSPSLGHSWLKGFMEEKKTGIFLFSFPFIITSSFFYLQSCERTFILTAELVRQINYTQLANFMVWDYACLVFKTKFNLLLLSLSYGSPNEQLLFKY